MGGAGGGGEEKSWEALEGREVGDDGGNSEESWRLEEWQ
jgi:hypothetical protein